MGEAVVLRAARRIVGLTAFRGAEARRPWIEREAVVRNIVAGLQVVPGQR
jgi:hypothetical protein